MRKFLFILCLLAASPAAASTFCLTLSGMTPQCEYEDAAQCRSRAAQLNAECTVSADAVYSITGSGDFCVMHSSRTALCAYPDRHACEVEASRSGGLCTPNPKPIHPAQH